VSRVPISLAKLVAYGLGGAGMQVMVSAVQTLVPPVFNVGYGLNPGWVALMLAAPLVWELFLNPFLGEASDRATRAGQTRWKYLIAGTLAGAVSFAATWWAPREPAVATYVWLALAMLMFRTAASTFAVPYAALGFDLSSDYHERTRISRGSAAWSRARGGSGSARRS
jgi:glycoside/pentoside/hexuronide:cation symporter, GPH family